VTEIVYLSLDWGKIQLRDENVNGTMRCESGMRSLWGWFGDVRGRKRGDTKTYLFGGSYGTRS